MVTPKDEDPTELVPFAMRMPVGLIRELDKRVAQRNRAPRSPWVKINRSDLIREYLARGLSAEDDPKPKP